MKKKYQIKKKQQEEIAKDIEDAEKNSKKWKFWRYIFAIVSKTFKLYVKEIECAEKITSLASKKNRTELEQTELSGNITEYRKIKKDIENKDKTAENNTTQENKKTPQSAISIKQDDKPEVTTAPNNTTHQDKEKNRDNTENLVKTRE